jgi:transcriptional regulator with XRE-family HTH domain
MNNIVNIISNLCQQRSKTINAVCKELKIGSASIKRWNTISPNVKSVEKVANYFNVTVDYLLGRSNIPDTPEKIINDKDMIFIYELKKEMSVNLNEKLMDFLVCLQNEYIKPDEKFDTKQFKITDETARS